MKLKFTLMLMLVGLLSACITYRDYPDNPDVSLIEKQSDNVVVRIKGFSFSGGAHAMMERIRDHSPFNEVEFTSEENISNGKFIDINIQGHPPSISALAFGYLSVSTLTLTPFWSTQDGSDVIITVFENGERIKSFDYQVRRSGFIWIAMLPLAWINFLTPDEADAFEAIANQFFLDFQDSEI